MKNNRIFIINNVSPQTQAESSYKASYYNIIHTTKTGETILYNTLSGAIARLTDPEIVKAILNNPNDKELKKRHSDIWNGLKDNKFIIPEDFDELSYIEYKNNLKKFNTEIFNLTILPSRACNFKCTYCFEDQINKIMDKKDVEETKLFFHSALSKYNPKAVNVIWYGGEPLLAMDIIKELSLFFIEQTDKKSIPYKANIITNGYLLNEDIAKTLVELQVKSIQITLDGPEDIHNKKRLSKDGNPTFQRIKNAIILASKTFERVDVRIHIDRESAQRIDELLNEPWLQSKNIHLHAGYLRDFSDTSCGIKSSMLKPQEFTLAEEKIMQKNRERQNIKFDPTHYIPTPRWSYCGANYEGNWIIGPGPYVYKCASAVDIGDEVGYLKNGQVIMKPKLLEWMNYTPLKDPTCRKCKYLPICMGGCITVRKRYPSPQAAGICDYWKAYTRNYLEKLATQK